MADLSSEVNYIIEDFIEYPENSGEYFFGTTGDGVFHLKDGVLRLFSESDGLSSRYTWNLYVDKKDNLWVTSYSGVSLWNGGGFTQLELNDVPDEVQFSKVFEDNEGNYWIGSQGNGLFKFRPAQISISTAVFSGDTVRCLTFSSFTLTTTSPKPWTPVTGQWFLR